MFTGLIETMGTVRVMQQSDQDWRLTIASGLNLEQVAMGASIAVSGVCLTVVAKGRDTFTVELSAATVARTRFGDLVAGDPVNLEQAMRVGDRLDGHLVQGHVDGVATVERIIPSGRSVAIWFRVPEGIGRYIIAKGSVAIEGVSLTVNQVEDAGAWTRFSVNIIPHTQKKTTLASLTAGQLVNLESDLIGRYVERLLNRGAKGPVAGIDENFLRENGYV